MHEWRSFFPFPNLNRRMSKENLTFNNMFGDLKRFLLVRGSWEGYIALVIKSHFWTQRSFDISVCGLNFFSMWTCGSRVQDSRKPESSSPGRVVLQNLGQHLIERRASFFLLNNWIHYGFVVREVVIILVYKIKNRV